MTELSPQELLDAAEAKQRAAANPAVSAWVRANAGTGKTHVLVQRMLRLLLSGAFPRSILCLTFTKNAAARQRRTGRRPLPVCVRDRCAGRAFHHDDPRLLRARAAPLQL